MDLLEDTEKGRWTLSIPEANSTNRADKKRKREEKTEKVFKEYYKFSNPALIRDYINLFSNAKVFHYAAKKHKYGKDVSGLKFMTKMFHKGAKVEMYEGQSEPISVAFVRDVRIFEGEMAVKIHWLKDATKDRAKGRDTLLSSELKRIVTISEEAFEIKLDDKEFVTSYSFTVKCDS